MPTNTGVKLNLRQLKNQSKDLLKAKKAGDLTAAKRLKVIPRITNATSDEVLAVRVTLMQVQHVIALENGFKNWSSLKRAAEMVSRNHE